MKVRWIQRVIGPLVGVFGLESPHTGIIKEKKDPREPLKNFHSEEVLHHYQREFNFELREAERPSVSFPFKKRMPWLHHWVKRRVIAQPQNRKIILGNS